MTADRAKARRDRLRAKGVCINAEMHGAATDGVLCTACRKTHKRTDDSPRRAPRHFVLIRQFAATIVIDTRRRTSCEQPVEMP